jgi:hypothetical protein
MASKGRTSTRLFALLQRADDRRDFDAFLKELENELGYATDLDKNVPTTVGVLNVGSQASATGITKQPLGHVVVFFDGRLAMVNGDQTGEFYWSGDNGVTARPLLGVKQGDFLYIGNGTNTPVMIAGKFFYLHYEVTR